MAGRRRIKSGNGGGLREQADYVAAHLLRYAPMQRRADGRWRFGTRSFAPSTIARVVAAGRGVIEGDQLRGVER